jgi:hypothetical protein
MASAKSEMAMPSSLRGRRLEQAEILPDAHGQRHHQGGPAQHGVGLPRETCGTWKELLMAAEDRRPLCLPSQ